MAEAQAYTLPDRGVVALTGPDALVWLDNLVSNDLTKLERTPLVFSALLSPQGKVLFEFFVFKAGESLLLETLGVNVEAFIKRLRLYKLRAKIELADVSAGLATVWGRGVPTVITASSLEGVDPRSNSALWRGLCPRFAVAEFAPVGDYVAERIKLGIAEAPMDYLLGDIFPHEANYDLQNGVSFTKGCYVGQEVVSRMQNKTVVRKRVVRISAAGTLTRGADVHAGTAVIGKVGSVAGDKALAMMRLDRAIEAVDGGIALMAGSQTINVDVAALQRYRQSVKDRPVIDL